VRGAKSRIGVEETVKALLFRRGALCEGIPVQENRLPGADARILSMSIPYRRDYPVVHPAQEAVIGLHVSPEEAIRELEVIFRELLGKERWLPEKRHEGCITEEQPAKDQFSEHQDDADSREGNHHPQKKGESRPGCLVCHWPRPWGLRCL
jgi:hypothetical protein